MPLLSYSNTQVRLQASHSLLVLFAADARKCLEDIRDSGIAPVYAYAASAWGRLDEGTYVRVDRSAQRLAEFRHELFAIHMGERGA